MTDQRIETRCPSCGMSTLFVSNNGHLICSWLECKQPSVERYVKAVKGRMDIYDIVTKLIGPVQPIGEHNGDQDRLDNMKTLTCLVESLHNDIGRASAAADRPEASMKAIGVHAREFMNAVKEG